MEKKRTLASALAIAARDFQNRRPKIEHSILIQLAYHKGLLISPGVTRAACEFPEGSPVGTMFFRVRTTDTIFDSSLIDCTMQATTFTKDKKAPPVLHRFVVSSSFMGTVSSTITLRKGYYEICLHDVPVASVKQWAHTLDRLAKRLVLNKELRQFQDFKAKDLVQCLPQI